ncbi:MAG TPA: glycosyl hydrolase [Prolixibacteraceae bacterium]|nr:glycosyl hydrolase [Prolixibacteraceae bacterium]
MKNLLAMLLIVFGLTVQAQKPVPSDPKATPEAVKLYQNMMNLQHKGLMFGHQDALAYGTSWYAEEGRSDVKDVCGDYPAIFGWELGHLETGNSFSLDSVYFDNIRSGIQKVNKMGGISTISWHFHNALTGGSAWDVSSKKAVASMLPGGEKHELYLQYLDKLADFMLSLKTDQGKFIPVLFRPFHEHTGSWFFWGKDLCSVDEYRTLWRFSVNYLRETRNVHHLLYTYSTDRFATPEEYLERYPGDDLVDIVAFDLYDRGSDYSATLSNCAKRVTKIAAEKGKIGAVSEAGGPISRNQEWWTNVLLKSLSPYDLSYVLVWRNPFNMPKEAAFGPYKGCPSEQDFVKFHNDPKTLFLKDIQ